jgi:hypothetical protein
MSASGSNGKDFAFNEWQEARAIMARFDNNLHDLRKYGFSFITALLAANGLISQGGSSAVPNGVKAAILMATLGLIVALKMLETHYRLFQKAASIRARLLENRLNIDITNDLSLFYDLQKWWVYVQALYYGFVGLVMVLGVAILWSDASLLGYTLIAGVIACLLLWTINKGTPTSVYDWSVDKKILNAKDSVRITFTDLDDKEREAVRYRLSWGVGKLSDQGAVQPVPGANGQADVQLRYFGSQDFLWQANVDPGLYRIRMTHEKGATGDGATKVVGALEMGGPGSQVTDITIQVTVAPKQPASS